MSESVKSLFKNFFEPKSVAFVGASETPGKWGFTIMLHILQAGYKGSLIPVNPKRDKVFGIPCAKSIPEIEGTPDLAILVIPAKYVKIVMQQCADKGIKAVVVITSGFAEAGEEGKAMQKEIAEIARKGGVRFVGPNSMGIYTGYPDPLMSIMSSVIPSPGPIAVLAQSGNLGVSLTGRFLRRGMGISRVVSVGNMGDLQMADYLEMLEDDEKTEIITIYLEGSSNGRRFMEACEKVTRKKPVVLLKGAKGKSGLKAAMSHTAALSGSYDTFKAAMQEVGVIVAESMDDVVNIAGSLHSHPLPKGNRVGVLTLGGGWGVLGSDACDQFGLDMAPLPQDIIDELNKDLPPYWSKGNPVDTVADTNVMMIPKILQMLMRSDAYDAVLYLGAGYLAYQGDTYSDHSEGIGPEIGAIGKQFVMMEKQMVDTLIANKDKMTKPLMPAADLVVRDRVMENNIVHYLEENGFLVHNAPWQATQGLRAMLDRKNYLDRIANQQPLMEPEVDEAKIKQAGKVIAEARKRGSKALTEHESKQILAAMNINCTEEFEAESVDQAVEFAGKLGYPLVLKVSSPDIIHKSDAGGVVLNIKTEEEVKKHAAKILKNGKVLVQKMAQSSPVELLVGLKSDPMFGPVIVFGKGGIETNVWNDATSLPAPIRAGQAKRMIEKTTVSKILGDFRGRKALDMDSLADLMVKVSFLPKYFPEISELDINPLFLYENGALVLDAAIVLSDKN